MYVCMLLFLYILMNIYSDIPLSLLSTDLGVYIQAIQMLLPSVGGSITKKSRNL